jgi:hypothetical protein
MIYQYFAISAAHIAGALDALVVVFVFVAKSFAIAVFAWVLDGGYFDIFNHITFFFELRISTF